MLKLIEKYRAAATAKNARALRDYDRKHPMARCMLNKPESELVADACHRADMGEA